MNFTDYLQNAWNVHATQTENTAQNFKDGFSLAATDADLVQLATLITHVFGEHLGQWREGLSALAKLKTHRAFEAGSEAARTVDRALQVLKLAQGDVAHFEHASPSDQIRILALTASALASRQPARALDLFLQATQLAQQSLEPKDPALRTLAVTANNLAGALEEKQNRTPQDTSFMILAAQTARAFWEKSGGWLEVSRAEYRLAMTYRQAGELAKAQQHARLCADICSARLAPPLDQFFAQEALALTGSEGAAKRAQDIFSQLPKEDQIWCASALDRLRQSSP